MTSKVIAHDHHHVRIYTRPLFVTYGITPSQGYISRAVAAFAATIVTSPFHVVQTLTQVASKEGRKSYSKIIEDLYNKEGITAFFKGSVVGGIRFATTAGLNYLIYLGVRKLLEDKSGTLTLENHQIVNATSMILSSILSYPLETIRTRLVLDWDNKKYTGAFDCLTNTIASEGYSGLFQGSILSSIGNYVMVELMERIWAPIRLGLTLVPPSLIDAALQSLIAQTLYYPIDTVLKMVQAPHSYWKLHPDVEFDGVVEAATSTISKHGILSLWRGYSISVLQVVPYLVVVGFSYEGMVRLFDEVNVHSQAPVVVVTNQPTKHVVTRVERLD